MLKLLLESVWDKRISFNIPLGEWIATVGRREGCIRGKARKGAPATPETTSRYWGLQRRVKAAGVWTTTECFVKQSREWPAVIWGLIREDIKELYISDLNMYMEQWSYFDYAIISCLGNMNGK